MSLSFKLVLSHQFVFDGIKKFKQVLDAGIMCDFCLYLKGKPPTIILIYNCLFQAMGMEDAGLTCGAVCVYPNRVAECVEALKRSTP